MILYDRFEQQAVEAGLHLTGLRVVLGASGGVDSTVLLDLLLHAGTEVVGVHVNYGLRGEESDLDEQHVLDLFRQRQLELVVKRISDERVSEPKGRSLQEVAREIRYLEMERVARAEGIDYVAVGHNLDDQAETVLMNLFRGTGLDGLAGMPVARPLSQGITLIRPLLFARREEIVDHARQVGLAWREDSSNTAKRYLRTSIRGEILPLIKEHFDASVSVRIAATADMVRSYLAESRLPTLESVVSRVDNGVILLRDDRVKELEPAVRKRLILEVLREVAPAAPRRRSVLDEINGLRSAQKGRQVELLGVKVVRERNGLLFVPSPGHGDHPSGDPVPLLIGRTTIIAGGLIHAQVLSSAPDNLDAGTPNIAFLDARLCGSNLQVRTWRDGDRMRPLGSSGTTKISDLLTDAGVSTSTRRDVSVVTSDKRIIWLVGHRVSADYAVGSRTSSVLMICFMPDPLSSPSDL